MALVEDLDVFLADFCVPVSFAGAPDGLLGIQDIEGAHVVGGSTLEGIQVVTAAMKTVMLRTVNVASLNIDDPITVNGIDYQVRDKQEAKPDGVFTVLALGAPGT